MNTCSFTFPNMFDVAKNTVGIYSDKSSILSRVRLLLLTEPTELYNNPTFGVGLRQYMFQYNQTDNILAIIKDRIIEQLMLWEPYVDAKKTEVIPNTSKDGLVLASDVNKLDFTVIVYTTFGDQLTIEF